VSSGLLTRDRTGRAPGPAAAARHDPVDPRLAARRHQVERDRGRRRRRRLGLGLGLVAVVGGAYGLTRTSLLDVDRVEVRGVGGPAADGVQDLVGVEPGTALVDVDTAAVERRVATLAWVANVSAARRWPGRIEVRVSARVPVAVDTDGVAVDATGRVLGTDGPARPDHLPRIDQALGRPGTVVDPRSRQVVEVLAALPPSLSAEVASGRAAGTDVVLTLVDGITVRMGDTSRLTAKFVAVEALLEQAGRTTIAGLDVRVPSSPSVRPVPGAERDPGSSLTTGPGAGA
jgi:cell division protein FtsQ